VKTREELTTENAALKRQIQDYEERIMALIEVVENLTKAEVQKWVVVPDYY
jgi:FtsZ-binding cell division protein ZapB